MTNKKIFTFSDTCPEMIKILLLVRALGAEEKFEYNYLVDTKGILL